MSDRSVIRQARSPIVELVGPAGAGKTTLARALTRRDSRIVVAADLELKNKEHFPLFLGHAPFLIPVVFRRCQGSRWYTWYEFKAMVYLNRWPSVLGQMALQNGTAILLDHGPVFKLATLDAFGPKRLKSRSLKEWWSNAFRQWASTLDMIVWLDASNANLVQRINTRSQKHAVKGKPEQEAVEFLSRYRASYGQILTALKAYREPMLLQFDTDQADIERIAERVLLACDTKHAVN